MQDRERERIRYRREDEDGSAEDRFVFKGGIRSIMAVQAVLCVLLLAAAIAAKYAAVEVYNNFRGAYDEIMQESYTGQQISQWVNKVKGWFDNAAAFVSASPSISEAMIYAGMGGGENLTYKQSFYGGAKTAMKPPAGASLAPAYLLGRIGAPVAYINISSPYGYRMHPVTGDLDFHTGMDFAAPEGAKIFAVSPGTALEVGKSEIYGNYIILSHKSFETFYGHCSEILAAPGAKLREGDVIAKAGSTGLTTGPHVHFEIRVNGTRYDANWIYKFPVNYNGNS
ncbi:MAG: M23 family metallopeptidase [Oscillospiraceae bacterium]|jgi:murein DD-endopeptidase MepM/ murein hydrolase activator NlpD|nr:M23 family metallopeptidase [Oscillospiraceae bacterium]